MIGLIKKDFYILKGNLKALGIMLIVFIGLNYFGEMDLSMLAPFMAVTLFISTFSYDEFNHFDIYGMTFPKGKKDVVKAKYITGIILTSISIVFVFLIGLVASLNSKVGTDLETSYACLISSFIVIALVVPMLFKFGAEKGRIAIFVFVYGILFLVFLVVNCNILKIPNEVAKLIYNNWKILLPTVAIILLISSYFLSNHFYKKREY